MEAEIFPGIFSNEYSAEDLECILLNRDGKHAVLALDLDGTIHRGILPRSFYESTNADLAFSLTPVVAKHSLRAFFEYALTGISLTSKIVGYHLGITEGNAEQLVKEMISEFSEKILTGLSYYEFLQTARFITRFAYPNSLECVTKLSAHYDKTMVISTSFQPVLKAYSEKLEKMADKNLRIETYGTKLLVRSDEILGLYAGILDSEEKARFLAQNVSGLERCVIFGNSENDIQMFNAGSKILGINCVRISINRSPKNLVQLSDVYIKNWDALKKFLSNPSK